MMNNHSRPSRSNSSRSDGGSGSGQPTAASFSSRSMLYSVILVGSLAGGWSLTHESFHDSLDSVLRSAAESTNTPSQQPVAVKTQRPVYTGQVRQSAASPPNPAKRLIKGLVSMDGSGAMTWQQTQSVRSGLLELVDLGPQAVPVIRNFLKSTKDMAFVTEGEDRFDHSSLHMALINALGQIGGFEAQQVLLEQLSETAMPAEILAIADVLDRLAPGIYTDSILEAAEERLAVLSAASAAEGRTETGPIFKVLQNYGNEDVAATLSRVPYWFQDYAQVALANLPDGQGVTILSQRVERDLRNLQGSRNLYLLAQVAVDIPQAETVLLGLVKSDQVPEVLWPTIGEILMGDRQLQIEDPSLNSESIGSLRGDNPYAIQTTVDRQVQTVYSVNYSAVFSEEEVTIRLDLINRLLSETSNSTAIRVLQDARATLEYYY